MNATLRIGTRGSPLALWQAHYVVDELRQLVPDCTLRLVEVETTGDVIRDRPLSQIGGDGLFTKEIQRALLENRVDVAVHSLKDLPTAPVEGLCLAAVPKRGPRGDAFVARRFPRFGDLPLGSTVGTSSLRRRAQLLRTRPDLRLVDVRGNVGTRLRKLDDGELDALVLAEAGLQRLGLGERITEILDMSWMLPAVGQGALGLECRADDTATLLRLAPLNNAATEQSVLAERAMLRKLGGGCLVPIGAAARVTENTLALQGAVFAADGSAHIDGEDSGNANEGEAIGIRLAEKLLGMGAAALLAR